MARDEIGTCQCPICDWKTASVRMSAGKAPKPYILCEECGFQGFTRGPKAVKALESKTQRHAAPPEPAPSPAPDPAPAPTPAEKPQPKPKKSFWEEMGL